MDAYMTFMYVVPHTRIGPFLVGMLMGYYLHARRGAIVVNRVSVPTTLPATTSKTNI